MRRPLRSTLFPYTTLLRSRETEVGGHAVGDVGPAFAAIVAAVEAPVVLQKHPVGPALRLRHLMHALAELGMFVREEVGRSEEHTSELQSRLHLVCRLLLEK